MVRLRLFSLIGMVYKMKLYSIAVLTLVAGVANADLLYDLSPYDSDLAFASDSVSGQFNNQRIAETFSLNQPAEIQRIVWWGRSEGAFFNDLRNMEFFTMAILEDSAGLPSAKLVTETALTAGVNPVEVGTTPGGIPIWQFDYTLANPISVGAGSYWFSTGSDNFDPDGDGFYWQAAVPKVSDSFAAQVPVGSSWEITGFADLAFQIHGIVVPEASTVLALLTGIALLAHRARRLRDE
jgi:hypothetical protein